MVLLSCRAYPHLKGQRHGGACFYESVPFKPFRWKGSVFMTKGLQRTLNAFPHSGPRASPCPKKQWMLSTAFTIRSNVLLWKVLAYFLADCFWDKRLCLCKTYSNGSTGENNSGFQVSTSQGNTPRNCCFKSILLMPLCVISWLTGGMVITMSSCFDEVILEQKQHNAEKHQTFFFLLHLSVTCFSIPHTWQKNSSRMSCSTDETTTKTLPFFLAESYWDVTSG